MVEPVESETSEFYESIRHSKPFFASNSEAIHAVALKLEQVAAQCGTTIDHLLEQAHTTQNSQPHHLEALSLERQLAFLRR